MRITQRYMIVGTTFDHLPSLVALAVVVVGGLTASFRRPRRSFHNWAAGHFHHSKNAQPMTRATGNNKDSGNAQWNENRQPAGTNGIHGRRYFLCIPLGTCPLSSGEQTTGTLYDVTIQDTSGAEKATPAVNGT